MFLFLILQLGDLITTLLFLHPGVAEGNPLIAAALGASGNPVISLLLAKVAGCALAWFAWKSGRLRLLRRANVFFALCVVWNVAAMVPR